MNSSTILIVDDQPENLAVLAELLESHYRIRAVNSGVRALQAAVTEPRPDLILLDVMMPEMDGYAVLSALRLNPATRDIPVIFVTARDAAMDEEYGLELGAADYITKPIRPAVVLARVHTQLENKQARDLLKHQNAYLEVEVARRMHDNELIQDASLNALAMLAETRDSDTGNHIHRTQAYVEAIAGALLEQPAYAGLLTPVQVRLIVRAAPLHDIGKVGVPDQVLCKPGKLTSEEFAIIKTHARIGGDAIDMAMRRVWDSDQSEFAGDSSPLAFLAIAGLIARWHHERWDGTGYPDGMRGEAIPLAARIMAVADVFDALTMRRVYKPAMPFDEAVALIEAGRGSQFDPLLVDIFLGMLPQFADIAARFQDD
jgi:putative two-component system response regulator